MNSLELDVRRQIESSEGLDDFINGKQSRLEVIVCGVPVYIYRMGDYAKLYYQLPFIVGYNYHNVSDFMNYAIPIISRMLAERKAQKISISDF